jgi:hypothetical protein
MVVGTHTLSPDRRKSVRGVCGKNLLFFTLRPKSVRTHREILAQWYVLQKTLELNSIV